MFGMNQSTERDTYVARCLRVAAAVRSAGVTLKKHDKPPLVEVSRDAKSVSFPIVTDDRLWRETTVEEAFYSVHVDARGWAGVDLSDTLVVDMPDDVEKSEVSLIKHDQATERERLTSLTDLLGGEQILSSLYATADLT
jgi:hypothetical protein